MAKLTRPKLATHYSGPRAGNRDFVSLEGRCGIGDGEADAVAILDLDTRGCRLKGFTAAVTKVDRMQLWIGDVGPVWGRLKWAKGGSAGIAFDQALDEAQLEAANRIATPAPSGQVVPIRRRMSEPGEAS